jgi:hypothetical protein
VHPRSQHRPLPQWAEDDRFGGKYQEVLFASKVEFASAPDSRRYDPRMPIDVLPDHYEAEAVALWGAAGSPPPARRRLAWL